MSIFIDQQQPTPGGQLNMTPPRLTEQRNRYWSTYKTVIIQLKLNKRLCMQVLVSVNYRIWSSGCQKNSAWDKSAHVCFPDTFDWEWKHKSVCLKNPFMHLLLQNFYYFSIIFCFPDVSILKQETSYEKPVRWVNSRAPRQFTEIITSHTVRLKRPNRPFRRLMQRYGRMQNLVISMRWHVKINCSVVAFVC